jgi:hypothetical protein
LNRKGEEEDMQTQRYALVCLLSGVVLVGLLGAACAKKQTVVTPVPAPPQALTTIHQIDSFVPEVSCDQALEVLSNNPFEQAFFEKVFARVVEQCNNKKAKENADVIWHHLVVPLKKSGKVPPDLATTIWNCYFSSQFVSLPAIGPVSHSCHRLPEVKKNLEKEYQLKKVGFEVCEEGSAEPHFLNAMYVYNTMWAVCHGIE